MTTKEIIEKHEILNKKLQMALATMERKDTIAKVRKEIMDLQSECPHFSDDPNFQWTYANGTCPFCGYTFAVEGREY